MKRKNTYSPISCLFSKHDFIQPALFTLLAMKIYTRSTYRQITDLSKWCKNTMTSSRSWMNCKLSILLFYCVLFYLRFFEAILCHEFLFSILFCCDYIIALGMKNCFGFEKLLWVRYSITFQMLSLIFYIYVIINEILFN